MRVADATVVVATRTEGRGARAAGAPFRVVRAGVGLRNWREEVVTPVVISAGLAGGLTDDLEPGTVVVAEHVAYAGGAPMACDPEWSDALRSAAREMRLPQRGGGLVTLPDMATGAERAAWAARDFVAVDMESGLLALRARRLAVVRVVLDTPARDVSARWRHPAIAAVHPSNWGDGVWLARHGPAYARRVGEVLAMCARRA